MKRYCYSLTNVEPIVTDAGLRVSPGYTVSAVDQLGNESKPTAPAEITP
jgi:hypothetical protein